MQNSMASMSKVSYNNKESSSTTGEEDEESGWTMYLQDFSLQSDVVQRNIEEEEYYDSSHTSEASSKGKKIANRSRRKTYNKNKHIDRRIFVDDDLEDTATSPVSSPKVKGITSINDDEIGFIGGERDCTELKKRGLCLGTILFNSTKSNSISSSNDVARYDWTTFKL